MASRKSFNSRPNYVYPVTEIAGKDENMFEFDESDVWTSNDRSLSGSFDSRIPIPSSRSYRKTGKLADTGSGSVPVNIPDWSTILKDEYKSHFQHGTVDAGDGGDVSGEGRVPPHEYLARRRGASLSVHEGIGRTLKGRDLRRVRNAIWQKTGFED